LQDWLENLQLSETTRPIEKTWGNVDDLNKVTGKYQLASVSSFKPLSVELVKFAELSDVFTTSDRYFQQRLCTPLIFFGASANGKPAISCTISKY